MLILKDVDDEELTPVIGVMNALMLMGLALIVIFGILFSIRFW